MTTLALAARAAILLLAALSMALSFAHLMELAPRLRWDPALWMATTNFGGLYYVFGTVGAVIDMAAIVGAATLTLLSRRQPAAFGLALCGTILLGAGLTAWFAFVAPANAVMTTWSPGVVPADFIAVRDRWEHSHAAIAVIKIAGFVALTAAALREAASRAWH